MPGEWNSIFSINSTKCFLPLPPHTYDLVCSGVIRNISSLVYRALGDDIMLLHNKYIKWREELGQDFDDALVDFGQTSQGDIQGDKCPKIEKFSV